MIRGVNRSTSLMPRPPPLHQQFNTKFSALTCIHKTVKNMLFIDSYISVFFCKLSLQMSSLFVCPHFSQSLPDILNIKNILELTTPKFSCVHSLYYHELCNTLYPRGVTWGKTIVSNSVPLKLDFTQYPFLKKPSHKKIF